jgi:hypothetical protein
MKMLPVPRVLGAVLAVVLLSGCLESKDVFILNPDGSGKVVHEATIQPVNLNINIETSAPDDEIKKTVRAELEKSEGVDAWRDVEWKRLNDGRAWFRGTAYFPDITKLKLHNGGFSSPSGKAIWTRDVSGKLTLELEQQKKQPAATEPVKLSVEEATAKVAKDRADYQRAKPMMAAMLGGVKAESAYRLPGKVSEASNMERISDNEVRIVFDGQKFLKVMDDLMADEAWMREQAMAGANLMKEGPQSSDFLNEKLYGQKAPIRVVAAGALKPQFDYAAEIAEAKKQQPDILKRLGVVDPVNVAPAPPGAGLRNVEVAGIRLVRMADNAAGIRPLNSDVGYALGLVAELPGAVLQVSGGALETATADDGSSLLPAKDWDRKISFPQLSQDKTKVVWEVKMSVPGNAVRGFKEASGYLEIMVAKGIKEVDTGIKTFQVGVAGTALGAEIKAIGPNKWEKGQTDMAVKLQLPRHAIKSVKLFNEAGEVVETSPDSWSQMGDVTTVTIGVKGSLPAGGRLMVEHHDNLEKYRAPFAVRDLDLLGRPVK